MGSVPATPTADQQIRSAEAASLSQSTMKHLSEGEAVLGMGMGGMGLGNGGISSATLHGCFGEGRMVAMKNVGNLSQNDGEMMLGENRSRSLSMQMVQEGAANNIVDGEVDVTDLIMMNGGEVVGGVKGLMLDKIKRYWLKKRLRCSQKKKVRYGCRQNLAKQRFRHQGRFITKEEMEKLDPDQIYDPNSKQTPKTKQIFKVYKDKHPKSLSCYSQHSRGDNFGEANSGGCSAGSGTPFKDEEANLAAMSAQSNNGSEQQQQPQMIMQIQ